MQENTAFDETSKDSQEVIAKSYSEGDVIPVKFEDVVVGVATVLSNGELSVTLNDSITDFGKKFPMDGFFMSFKDEPTDEGYYPEALCPKCDLPASHIQSCE